jgi:hypothetical protein
LDPHNGHSVKFLIFSFVFTITLGELITTLTVDAGRILGTWVIPDTGAGFVFVLIALRCIALDATADPPHPPHAIMTSPFLLQYVE